MEEESKINSFMEHVELEELEEFKVMKSPVVLLGSMAMLHRKLKSQEDKTLAKMTWLGAQMTFSFMGELEKKIDLLNEEIKRLKNG